MIPSNVHTRMVCLHKIEFVQPGVLRPGHGGDEGGGECVGRWPRGPGFLVQPF